MSSDCDWKGLQPTAPDNGTVDIQTAIRDVLEREGTGPSQWAVRDCISLIRSTIAAHGIEPTFGLPEELGLCIDEAHAVEESKRVFGSLREGWLTTIERCAELHEHEGDPRPGMIGLTAAVYRLDGLAPTWSPGLAVYGPDLKPVCRTPSGLAVAHPIERVWRVSV